ncbi:unnamed protein product [Paramecium octaurelia]|uniref:Uncharacterized protein n=1 Tax=Paramecium octaurelia TaxID=43137 RepID=A0A8S1VZJ3_PAROT|nr:unnamed protein product [Paramecium octaurelia]
MNCTYHHHPVTMICIAPHQNQCQRRLCPECQDEHQVDTQYIISIKRFKEMVNKKLKESNLDNYCELRNQRTNFKSLISQYETMLKQIWEKLQESIKQIYDAIERENTSYLTIMNEVNPTELSNTNFEKLVQIVIGKTLDVKIDITNSVLESLQIMQNQLEQETNAFQEKLQKKMIEKISKIKQASEISIQPIWVTQQGYERKEELYDVLAYTKYIDEQFLKRIIEKIRKAKITDCIEFLSNLSKKSNINQSQRNFIINIIKNISEICFNKKNYSSENYQEIKKDLIKQIAGEEKIVQFLKFLVQLTAFDEKFIQSGSNSLNLLVEMKVNVKEQNFENIRIKDSSLVGGNFARCNFNGSHFDNVDISGVNFNQAQLFNCKWRNIKIHELNKLDGHSSYVQSVCFSPDGTTLASGSYDGSIRFWDVKTGQQKAKLDGHDDNQSPFVYQICFSPDGTTLASGSQDSSITLWDVKTCSQIGKLQGHRDSVYSVCFSPDGMTLASGSQDKSICLWDAKTGQQKCKLKDQEQYVYSVCFSPDGTTLASGSGECSVLLWDVKTGQQKAKLDGHTESVMSICFSPDGTILASGGDDLSILLWDVYTGKIKAKYNGHLKSVQSVCFSSDGTILASGSSDNSIRLWDVQTGQLEACLEVHSDYVMSVCFSHVQNILASGSSDKSIRIWDVKTRQQQAELIVHKQYITSVCVSPDGSTLATISGDQPKGLWDVQSGQQILPSDQRYKDTLAQFKPPMFNYKLLPESAISTLNILKISQKPILEAKAALIFQGEFLNSKGEDQRSLFKGSFILENYIESNSQEY